MFSRQASRPRRISATKKGQTKDELRAEICDNARRKGKVQVAARLDREAGPTSPTPSKEAED